MAENSGISWTDHTFNPWMGCTKVSPACKNCYAERDMDHRYGKVVWGPSGTRVVTSDSNWKKPIRWNKEAGELGIRYRVFCASLADVFEDWSGQIVNSQGIQMGLDYRSSDGKYRPTTMKDLRIRLFELIDSTPNLDWLLLTKRPENILRLWPARSDYHYVPEAGSLNEFPMHRRDNVWIGTSVENQEYADKRIPDLLNCRDLTPVLFLSCEPLVGPVDLTMIATNPPYEGIDSLGGSCFDYVAQETRSNTKLDWVIAGGESGPCARETNPTWFRSIRDQCQSAGVPFHFKQWGEWLPDTQNPNMDPSDLPQDSTFAIRVGTKKSGRLLDGVLHDAFPEVQHAS